MPTNPELRILVQAELRQVEAQMKLLERAIERATKTDAIRRLGQSFNDAATHAARLRAMVANQGTEAERAGLRSATAAQKHTAALKQQDTVIQQNTKAINGMNKSLEGFNTRGKFTVRVLEAFFLYRGFVFLQQGIVNSTRALIDLNHQLALVQTQLPGMDAQMARGLGAGVLDVARTTGLDINSTAKALYNITSAGYSGAEAMNVLRLSAQAAISGGLADVDVAFNSAVASMNSFGIEASQLEMVLDKQFSAVRRGIFTYEQFSTQVGVLSEAFAQAGQSIDTTYAAMATVSQVFTGPQFARGATGLRNLAEALTQHRDDFESMGIAVVDVDGNIRNLIDVVSDLKDLTDSMTTAERASLISEILPDVREQAGVVALMENLDDLKRNYVEQKLALGELDKSYKVVEKSFRTQANILSNNVALGFGTVNTAVGQTISLFNGLEKTMPGLTTSIVSMTTAVLALGAATAFLGGATGKSFVKGLKSPLAIGTAIGIGAGSIGVGVGNRLQRDQSERNAAGFFGSVAAGGAVGATGFLTGNPLIGGVTTGVGAIAGGISYLRRAEEVGQTFADAFTDALEENAGDIGKSIADALAAAQGQTQEYKSFQTMLEQGLLPSSQMQFVSSATTGRRTFLDRIAPGKVAAPVNRPIMEVMAEARTAVLAAEREMAKPQNVALLRLQASREGVDFDQFYQGTLQASRQDAAMRAVGQSGQGATLLLDAMAASGEDAAKFAEYIGLLSGEDGLVRFYDAIKRAPEEIAGQFATISARFNSLATGDFGLASEVFKQLGAEGEKLAEVFGRINSIMSGFAVLETLRATTYQDPRLAGFAQTARASAEAARARGDTSAAEAYERRASRIDTLSNRSVLGSEEDILAIAGMGRDALETEIARIRNEMGVDRNSAIGQLLFGGTYGSSTAASGPSLGSSSLADALFEGAEAIRQGLIDPMGYTADQLEMMGEELQAFNQIMSKVTILEELQRIAKLTGMNFTALEKGSADYFNQAFADAGINLSSLFSDPEKLAQFLSSMEVGDINVDQSMNNQIVIRISGDSLLDPTKAAQAADTLMRELRKRK